MILINMFLDKFSHVIFLCLTLSYIRYGRLAPTAVATARQKHKSSSSSAANCAIARALLIASLPDLEAYNAEIEFLAAQKAAANASSGSGVPTDAARNMVKTEAVAKAKAEIESAEGNESAFKDLLGNETVAAIFLSFWSTITFHLKFHLNLW